MSAAAAAPPRSRSRKRSAPAGHVFGIDVSGPMLDRARQSRAGGPAGRFRAGRRDRLSIRSGKFRSSGLAIWRDVLCRSGALLRQYAAGAAAARAGWLSLAGASRAKTRSSWRRCRRSTSTSRSCRSMGRRIRDRSRLPPKQRVRRILGEAGFTAIAMEPYHLALDVAIGRGSGSSGAGRTRNRPGQPRAGWPSAGGARCRGQFGPRGAGAFRRGRRCGCRHRSGS